MAKNNSYIGWIDFNEEDQKRAHDYLRALEQDTVDELGFGIMRDVISRQLFPGVTSIMTWSRYYIFVPAICKYVEKRGLSGDRAFRECEGIEQKLRILLANKRLIKINQERVERYPSSIYWSGLKQLGVLQRPMSREYYFDHLAEYYESKKTYIDDDKSAHLLGESREYWDHDFTNIYEEGETTRVTADGEFPDNTDLNLTRGEAVYLHKKYRELANKEPVSLISHLLERGIPAEFYYPWECSQPETLKKLIYHAQRYSMLAQGATLIYYEMLNQKRRERGLAAPNKALLEFVESWWGLAHDIIASWDLTDFIQKMVEYNASRIGDAGFLINFQVFIRKHQNAGQFFHDPALRLLIAKREKSKRPQKARLVYPKYLEQWAFDPALQQRLENSREIPYKFDFNASIASRFVQEILAGEKKRRHG